MKMIGVMILLKRHFQQKRSSEPDELLVRELTAYEAAVIVKYRLSGRAFNAIKNNCGDWPLDRFRAALRGIPPEFRDKYLSELDVIRGIPNENDVHKLMYMKNVGPKTLHELRRIFTGAL